MALIKKDQLYRRKSSAVALNFNATKKSPNLGSLKKSFKRIKRCLRSNSVPSADAIAVVKFCAAKMNTFDYQLLSPKKSNAAFMRDRFESSLAELMESSFPKSENVSQLSQQWNEAVSSEFLQKFREENSLEQLKLQIAIHEMFTCEFNLCFNINLLIKLFRPLMVDSGIISGPESSLVFNHLKPLYAVHYQLVETLANLRDEDGVYRVPGRAVNEWINKLAAYEGYCVNLSEAKTFIRLKMKSSQFVKFMADNQLLKDYSNKLDLLSFLDQPRRHLMKYSLLLGAIIKLDHDDEDVDYLKAAVVQADGILRSIEKCISEQSYRRMVDKLVFGDTARDETNRRRLEDSDTFVLKCSITCKAKARRASLTLFLFDRCLVLGQRMFCNMASKYQVIGTVCPNSKLFYETVLDKKSRLKSRSKLLWELRKQASKYRGGGFSSSSTTDYHQIRLFTADDVDERLDVYLKLQNAEEANLWIKRMKTYYALASTDASSGPNHSRTATALSCAYVLE